MRLDGIFGRRHRRARMENVIYLDGADRRCHTCACTLAVAPAQVRRVPVLALTLTQDCPVCGRQIEAETPASPDGQAGAGLIAHCDDCGAESDLVHATITLPDGMGRGFIFLCADCIERYDEGDPVHG